MAKRILALFGKSGAGKTAIQNLIIKAGEKNQVFKPIISCTTRPMRKGEINGIDYHFITKEQFKKLFMQNKFIEVMEYNGWFYGTLISELSDDKINIGVFTPGGIRCIIEEIEVYKLDVCLFCVYIRCSSAKRIYRVLERHKADHNYDLNEIYRRYRTDEQDFMHIDFPYVTLYNEKEPMDELEIIHTMGDYIREAFES